jgi:hypothetical protein
MTRDHLTEVDLSLDEHCGIPVGVECDSAVRSI